MNRRARLGRAAAAALAACAAPVVVPDGSGPRPSRGRAAEIVASLTLEQRVGQLMSIAFHGKRITAAVETMIRERSVGGLVLRSENFEDATALARLCADLQAIARDARVPPLLLSLDQEGGSVIRIGRGATIVPGQMALAASPDPVAAITAAARITAAELHAFGVGWDLAPVADTNDEPRNPIIGNRSFGSDPRRVATLVAEAVAVYRAQGMLSCVKHFPGHGSTTVDSHTGLPEIAGDRRRLDAVELVPFEAAIAAAAPAIMSGHIVVPALDPSPGTPVTLSKRVMTDVLRGELGFRGLLVSDDLEMGALASFGEARAGLAAFQAGVDHLLFRFDEGAQLEGHRLIVEAMRAGRTPAARLDEAAGRCVDAKIQAGLYDDRRWPAPDLDQNARIAMDLARQTVTVLKNDGALPLRGKVFAIAKSDADLSTVPGDSDLATELAAIRPDTTGRKFTQPTDEVIANAVSEARAADTVVVGVADAGASDGQRRLVAALAATRPTILVSLRSPYDAMYVSDVAAIVCTYGARVPTLRAAAEVLTGARRSVGRLPVDIPGRYAIGAGL